MPAENRDVRGNEIKPASVNTEEQSNAAPDGTPTIRFRGTGDSDGAVNRDGNETVVEKDPDNPDSGWARLTFKESIEEGVAIGRLHDTGTEVTSHEVLKFPDSGNVSIEAEGPGKLRLQSSSQPTSVYGVQTGVGVQVETHDSGGENKVPRMQFSQGQDLTNIDLKNLSLVRIHDDIPLNFGESDKARAEYNSTNDDFELDTDTGNLLLRAQNATHVGLLGTESKMFADLNLNGQTFKNPPREGSSTDPRADTTPDDYMHVNIGGTLHYIPLYT